jgi:hypothetical protein
MSSPTIDDYVQYSEVAPLSTDPRENAINWLISMPDRKIRKYVENIIKDLDSLYPDIFKKFFSGNRKLIEEAKKDIERIEKEMQTP